MVDPIRTDSSKVQTRDCGANPYFDLVRGLAALLVLFHHASGSVLEGYSSISNPSLIERGFYFVSGMGHEAVVVFFVLSGFLIFGNGSIGGSQWRWKRYVKNRLVRLWVVLLPSLLISLVLFCLFGSNFENQMKDVTWQVFLGNLAFLQTIFFPCFAGNQPLWSLSNEFWYYVLFPLLAIACSRHRLLKARVFCTVTALVFCVFLPFTILIGFPVWLLGCLARLTSNHIRSIWIYGWIARAVSVLIFVVAVVLGKYLHPVWMRDLIEGLAFSMTLVAFSRFSPANRWWEHSASIVSKMSYSLYLFHFPILQAIRNLVGKAKPYSFGGAGFSMLAVYLVLTIFFCAFAYFLFERNTPKIHRVLSSLSAVWVNQSRTI